MDTAYVYVALIAALAILAVVLLYREIFRLRQDLRSVKETLSDMRSREKHPHAVVEETWAKAGSCGYPSYTEYPSTESRVRAVAAAECERIHTKVDALAEALGYKHVPPNWVRTGDKYVRVVTESPRETGRD